MKKALAWLLFYSAALDKNIQARKPCTNTCPTYTWSHIHNRFPYSTQCLPNQKEENAKKVSEVSNTCMKSWNWHVNFHSSRTIKDCYYSLMIQNGLNLIYQCQKTSIRPWRTASCVYLCIHSFHWLQGIWQQKWPSCASSPWKGLKWEPFVRQRSINTHGTGQ